MKYERPILEIVEFETYDVICASGDEEGDYDGGWVTG
jgi:hypothetical protein